MVEQVRMEQGSRGQRKCASGSPVQLFTSSPFSAQAPPVQFFTFPGAAATCSRITSPGTKSLGAFFIPASQLEYARQHETV